MEGLTGSKPRVFSVEFKQQAARRLLAGESGTALSRELEVKRSVLYRWRDAYRAAGVGGLSRRRGTPAGRERATTPAPARAAPGTHPRTRTLAGETSRRAGFFRTNLSRCEPRAPGPRRAWRERIYSIIDEIRAQGPLSVERLCELGRVSRAGLYRRLQRRRPREADGEMRDRIQRIALDNRRYGYRRVGAELRRQGWVVNHKKVLRLLGKDNLLAVKKRRFVLTTETSPFLPVYPNLAQRLQVDGLDQLWVADITYIRLRETFVYLAVVLDAFSRRAIGWELGETLGAELALAALRQALATRRAGPGLVHHSDRGVQYTSRAYVELLESRGVLLSMSRRGNPYDNARAESFMKTLKSEEVALWHYRDLAQARASIGHFLEQIYNRRRLHSALGYVPPVEFEAAVAAAERREPGRVRYGFSQA